MRFWILLPALLLGGCALESASSENIQKQHDQQCSQMGAPRTSPLYTQCRMALYQQHEQNRQIERARLGMMLQDLGNDLGNRQPAYVPPPVLAPTMVQCRHQPMGAGVVRTTCY